MKKIPKKYLQIILNVSLILSIPIIGNIVRTSNLEIYQLNVESEIKNFEDLKREIESGSTDLFFSEAKIFIANSNIKVPGNFRMDGNHSILDMQSYQFILEEGDIELSNLTLRGERPFHAVNSLNFKGETILEVESLIANHLEISGIFEMRGEGVQLKGNGYGDFEIAANAIVMIEGDVLNYERYRFGRESIFTGYRIQSETVTDFEIGESAHVNLESALKLESSNDVAIIIKNKGELIVLSHYDRGEIPLMIDGELKLMVHKEGMMIISSDSIGMLLSGNEDKQLFVEGFLSVTGALVAIDQSNLAMSVQSGGKVQLETFNEELSYGTLYSAGAATYRVEGLGSMMTVLYHGGPNGAIHHSGLKDLNIEVFEGGLMRVMHHNEVISSEVGRAAIVAEEESVKSSIVIKGEGSTLDIKNEGKADVISPNGAIDINGNLYILDGGRLQVMNKNLSPTLSLGYGRIIVDETGCVEIIN